MKLYKLTIYHASLFEWPESIKELKKELEKKGGSVTSVPSTFNDCFDIKYEEESASAHFNKPLGDGFRIYLYGLKNEKLLDEFVVEEKR